MNREQELLSIRPILELKNINTKPIEKFQNETLRPILKLQHDFTQFLLINHQNYDAASNTKSDEEEYRKYMKKFIQSNVGFKNQLLGAVIGHFINAELKFYLIHRKELNKRIIQMQINRYFDTFIYQE